MLDRKKPDLRRHLGGSTWPVRDQVQLHEAPLAGQSGAELEYTCGEGDAKRHGIWRALVKDGNAIHFYLTVPDNRFSESKIIFAEMVRSFQLVG